MTKFQYILLLSLIIAANSCEHKINVSYTMYDSDTIKNIDLNPCLSNEYYEVSDILDSINIVCLETKDESILSMMTGMIITEDRIFVRDSYNGVGIVIFDSNGRFIKRLSRGNGPDEFPFCNDFAYDKVSDELLILSNKIQIFDKNGNHKGNTELSFWCSGILSCNKNGYVLCNLPDIESDIPTLSNYSTLVTDRNFNLKQFLLPFSKSNKIVRTKNVSIEYNDNTIISVPFCDTIYKLRNDSLSPYITLDFSSEKRDMEQYKSIEEYHEKVIMVGDISKAVFLGKFYENSTHQIIGLEYSSILCSIFINKSNNKVISGYDCSFFNEEEIALAVPSGVYNDWFYQVKEASSFQHNTITSNRYISKEDLAKLERMKDDDNPFILFYKLKNF